MTAKTYLERLKRLDDEINEHLKEISELRSMACNVSVASDKERVQTSLDGGKIENLVAKIIDLERETDELTDKFADLKNEVTIKISLLANERQKEILFKKYVEYKSIYFIAGYLGITDRGCKKAHKKALSEFEKYL